MRLFKSFTSWQKVQLFYIVFELLNSCVYYQFKIIPNIVIIEFYAVITLLLFIKYYAQHINELKNIRFVCVMILLLLLVVSTIFRLPMYSNYKFSKAFKTILVQFIWLLLLFSCPQVKTKSELENSLVFKNLVFQMVVLFTFCVSIASLIFWIVVIPFGVDITAYTSLDIVQDGRLCALYFNSDLAGITSLISLLLSVSLLKQKIFMFSKINRANVFIQICILILSGCRSAILPFSLIVAYIIITYLHKKHPKFNVHKSVIFLCIAAIFLQVILTILRMPNYEFSGKSFDAILNKLTASRYSLWKEAILLSMSSPIWGNGLYTMVALAKLTLSPTSVIIKRNYDLCHNLFIAAFYSTGIIGLGSVIALTKSIVQQLKFFKSYIDPGVFQCDVFIIFSLFIYSLFNPAILFVTDFPAPVFWLLIGNIIIQNNYRMLINNCL